MLIAAGGVLLGAWLLRLGLVGRRVGDTPFCRKCGYNLTGIAHDRCPECGQVLSLPRAITLGERRRRRGLLWCGALLATLSAFILSITVYGRVARIEWYHYAPNWYVIRDAGSRDPTVSYLAYLEVYRRRGIRELPESDLIRLADVGLSIPSTSGSTFLSAYGTRQLYLAESYPQRWFGDERREKLVDLLLDALQRGHEAEQRIAWGFLQRCREFRELSALQLSRYVEIALHEQTVSPLTSPLLEKLIDMLAEMHTANRLTESQKARFLANLLRVTLHLPPQVAAGEAVIYTVVLVNRVPSDWWYNLELGPISIDGVAEGNGTGSQSGPGSFERSHTFRRVSNPIAAPGIHRVEVLVELLIFGGGNEEVDADIILRRQEVLTGTVEVLPDLPNPTPNSP